MPRKKVPLEKTVYIAVRWTKERGFYPDIITAGYFLSSCLRRYEMGEERKNLRKRWKKSSHGKLVRISKFKLIEEREVTREELAKCSGSAD